MPLFEPVIRTVSVMVVLRMCVPVQTALSCFDRVFGLYTLSEARAKMPSERSVSDKVSGASVQRSSQSDTPIPRHLG